MGLWKEVRCPMCGKEGARKFLWMVKCPMRGCPNYDHSLGQTQSSDGDARDSVPHEPRPKVEHVGSFDPGAFSVTIQYTNHQEESCEFITDWRTLKDSGKYVSACLVPTGTRCAFKRSKVDNIDELEPHLDTVRVLNKTEKKILGKYIGKGIDHKRVPAILEKIG